MDINKCINKKGGKIQKPKGNSVLLSASRLFHSGCANARQAIRLQGRMREGEGEGERGRGSSCLRF